MAVETGGPSELIKIVSLLGAAIVAVPIFRKIGLGSVLGYLAAGLAIGPFGLRWFTEAGSILHVAELGVVMFLFIIGLEMKPSHLWSLRGEIFGLGSLQIAICTAALTLVGVLFGFSIPISFICAMGFVLTSTAIVMQVLNERGDAALPRGQKIISILLFEDLLIVPLLIIVAFMSPNVVAHEEGIQWAPFFIAIGALATLIVAGIWLLNPLFRLLASSKAPELLTAAALLVVLGSALLMQVSGLSMAMGAFLAGVLLAESTFRHQIEADIEPFRGILLGLFFIGVGMALNLEVVAENWQLILSGVFVMMIVKAICIYGVARILKSSHEEAMDRATIMAQGGEFAFVLYAAAASAGIIDSTVNANITAIVVLSMVLTPLVVIIYKKFRTKTKSNMDGIEEANGLAGSVLIVGFGRFGQVTSQLLLARNTDVTIIDNDTDMIRNAKNFGFKIYYGDARRLDVLKASGAHKASVIAVCVNDKDAANKVVELAKSEFPQAKILVRAYDRTHARELIEADVDFQIRETFESAIQFGKAALCKIGVEKEEAEEIAEEIRRRDAERLQLELADKTTGVEAARKLMFGNISKASTPVPFTKPQRESKSLSQETATISTESTS